VNGRCLSNAADGRPARTNPRRLAREQPVDLPVRGELVVLAAGDQEDRGRRLLPGLPAPGVGEDAVVEGPVQAVGALRGLRGHRAVAHLRGAGAGARRPRAAVPGQAHRRAAVAAVREDQHAHARGELPEQRVQLVVDQLAVEEAPGLVLGVGLVAVQVRERPAVPPPLVSAASASQAFSSPAQPP
jgi:hypothetical protein